MEKGKSNKRPKKIIPCPNPLFEKWLSEWRDDAVKKGRKIHHVYTKALNSLQTYPLPLKNGRQAKQLDYFGDKICEMLDKKLAEHTKSQDSTVSDVADDVLPCFVTGDDEFERNLSPASTPPPKKRRPVNPRAYVPVVRSGAYALVVTLYQNHCRNGPQAHMSKLSLTNAAQPLSEKSFTVPDPGSYYTAWSSMATLIRKGLVLKENSPAKYFLTESGMDLGEKLSQHAALVQVNVTSDMGQASSTVSSQGSVSSITSGIAGINSIPYSQSSADRMSSATCSQSSTLDNQVCLSSTAMLASNSSSSSSSLGAPTSRHFTIQPGQFDIVLCVDNCETTTGAVNNRKLAVQTDLRKNGVNFDVRKLHVGDFVWVARERTTYRPGQLQLPERRELVLDYVVERKRMDDLAGSIRDGRFHEQKFRLKHSGLRCPIYLIEEMGSNYQSSIPEATLHQAVVNTQVIDKFTVKHTKSLAGTVMYLTIMTRYLQSTYANKTLRSCSKDDLTTTMPKPTEDNVHSLMTFAEFNAASIKNKDMTVKDMFAKHLLQIHGLSVDKAAAILFSYPTPSSLIQAYDHCSNDTDKERLLASLKFGKLQRKLGPALSKILGQVYGNVPVVRK